MLLNFSSRVVALFLAIALIPFSASAIIVQLDYTYDTSNFFDVGTAARDRLEDAAEFYEDLLLDDLDAITPTDNYTPPFFQANSWEVSFTNPSTGNPQTVADLIVPEDTVIIYVGAQSFSGTQLAEAGFGGAASFGTADWNNTVTTRGESGVGTTDFAPWGGFLSVDNGTTWDTSVDGNGTDQHLFSTLLHEIAHVLGLGSAPSWDAQVNLSGEFTGAAAIADYGSNVPLGFSSDTGRYDHWATGLTSNIWGTTTPQEVALDPDIVSGEVKLMTYLDIAGLDDLGWDIAPIPEPSHLALLGCGVLLLLRRRR